MDFLWTTYITASLLILAAQQTQSREIEVDMLVSTQPAGSPKKRIKVNLDIGDGDVNLNEIRERVQAIIQQTNDNRCAVTTVTSNDVTSTSDVTSTPDITTTTEKVPSTMPVETTDVIPTTENVVTNTPDIITTTEKVTSTTLVKTTDVTPTTENVVTNTPDITTPTEKVPSTTPESLIEQTIIMDNGYKYHLLKTSGFCHGKVTCEKLNGTLAVHAVNNYTVMEKITTNIRTQYNANQMWLKEIFVGFTDSKEDGNFTADDGTVVKEPEGRTPWNIHEPNNAVNGEDCVYVITTGSPRLNDVNCGKGIFGLCECNSTISGGISDIVISGFTYFLTNGEKNAANAEAYCKEMNATLAIRAVNDYEIMRDVLLRINTTENLYVGFNDNEIETEFMAIDGTPLMETMGGTQWNFGQPTDIVDKTECVSVQLYKSPKLRVSDCNETSFALCEIPN